MVSAMGSPKGAIAQAGGSSLFTRNPETYQLKFGSIA